MIASKNFERDGGKFQTNSDGKNPKNSMKPWYNQQINYMKYRAKSVQLLNLHLYRHPRGYPVTLLYGDSGTYPGIGSTAITGWLS